ncbi:unnamed protein product [Sphenostylis stenocarpa]|uniref:Uncharacterized protein n=1 Tax=Sphenostylis stenocarpa TaxID=92480 RepID=A0AA86SZF4_9FABA|nr:unnamed protein product [Sphenostylis stenocarpa]
MRSGSRIRPGGDRQVCGDVAHCGSGGRTRVPAAATMKVPPPPPGFREAESDSPPALRLKGVVDYIQFGWIDWNPNYGDLFIQCEVWIGVAMVKGRDACYNQ